MARTTEGASLTEQHRLAQIAVRARIIRDFVRLWPLWEGDTATFRRLVDATSPLLTVGYTLSRSLAASYFTSFRTAEGVPGRAAPRLAGPVDTGRAAGTLYTVGLGTHRRATAAGRPPEASREAALVRMSGTLTQQVLTGGRETIITSVKADPEARGWGRVTAPNPCAFCALLASRGPVYKEDTVGFEAHAHCTCGVEASYDGSEWPGRGREFKALYNQALREARKAGELKRGTANDSLNAFRRLLATTT